MKTIVIFSGAGLSADSGIPTFRGKNGLWEGTKVEDVSDHDAWFRNPELVLRFFSERYKKYSECKPHAGHYAIAKLQEKYNVINVTQNIDGLLEEAGCKDVDHLHGVINRKKCEWHKDIVTLDGDTRFTCDYKAPMDGPVELGDKCPKCNGQMRPDVVWFGEAVHQNYDKMASLVKDVKYNDGIFICCGTSIQVYPAGYYVSFFSQVKNKYIVDPYPQKISDYTLLTGGAAEQLPLLVDKLLMD